MIYPLVRELAVDGIAVTVTCRVLKIARQPYYRWLADPVTDAEWVEAHRANALFEAHADDPEFGYRYLADEAREGGQVMADRTAWRICSANGWWSVFGKKRGQRQETQARDARLPGSRAAGLHRGRAEPTVADRHHRAPHRRGQAVPLRDQGRVLEPDRRLVHRFSDEGPTRRRRDRDRRRSSR